MSWSIATIDPLMRFGAFSARYTGTVADAAPTANPSTKRKTYITNTFGENVVPRAPSKKMTASIVMI